MNHSFFANKKQPAGNRFLAGCFACWRAVPMWGRLLKEGMKCEKWRGAVYRAMYFFPFWIYMPLVAFVILSPRRL